MGWQDDPITVAAGPSSLPGPWDNDPITGPRTAAGVLDAIQAGYQGGGTGLFMRGKLPDVVLDPHHAKWYEKAAAGMSQTVSEMPQMVLGGAFGRAAGAVMGAPAGAPGMVVGGVLGGGAGAFAVPALIRSTLIEAYKSGTAQSSGDFLNSAAIVIKNTAKEALVGAATMGAGAAVGRTVMSGLAPAIGESIAAKTAVRAAEGSALTAELGTMVVAPAALEGKLPEWEDFLNAAIVLGGVKASVGVAGKVGDIYARTGIPPEEVVALAKKDPTIVKDLVGTPGEEIAPSSLRNMADGGTSAQFGEKTLTQDGKVISKVEFWKSAEGISISKIETDPAARRTGAATRLMDDLLAEFPGEKFTTSLRTASGREFFKQYDSGSGVLAPRDALPRAFREAAVQASAQEAVLDPGAAKAFVEKPFAEIPQAPGTPKVKLNVNYDYINSPEEAKAALARATELYGPKILEQTRGKVSWDATEAEARQRLAEMTETRDTSLLDAREPGTASNATELLLRRQILEGAVEDFTAKSRAYDAQKSSPEAGIQILAAAERVAMLSAQFQGAASEAGRALNILKNARDTARSAEQVAELLKTYDRDPAQIAAIMKTVNNLVAAAKAAREIVKPGPMDMVYEGLKSAMISGPVTITANLIGNMTTLPLRPLIDAAAAPIGLMRGEGRVSLTEPVARVMGNWQGMVDALIAAGKFIEAAHTENRARLDAASGVKETLGAVKENLLEPLRKIDQISQGKTETQKRAIPGDIGVLIRSPFMTLSVPDQLFRMMIERGEANTIAARQAAKEGLTPGSREFMERMAEVRETFTEAEQKAITDAGARGTYNAAPGAIGRAVKGVADAFGPLGFIVAPFTRTPGNLMKETLRLTPFAPIIDTWRADFNAGGAAKDRAIAEMMVGGGIAAVVVGLASSGQMTGAGDPDPNKKRVDLAAGEQPYSFKDANGKYFEFQRLQPIGTLLGLAADFSAIFDAFENPQERDKVMKMIGVAFASAITNQTMLQGLTNVVRAMSEPDRFFERWVQSVAAMPVPGALAQWSALNDPYLREIRTVLDAVKNRTPFRTTLEPKIDVWGDPILNRERVGGIGPSRTMEASQDKVKTEAAKLGVSVPKPEDTIQMPGVKGDRKLAEVKLTPEQQTQLAVTTGKRAYEVMQVIVNQPDWDSTPPWLQKMQYQMAFEGARKFGRSQILSEEQRTAEVTRIQEEVARRLAPPSARK